MDQKYLTVSALTKYLKRKFELDKHLKEIWLKGEISNFKHHSRGHMYLTLKDDKSRIQAVMFAGNNRYMKFRPENGMNVLIKGEINIYEPQGQYQLYIQQMEPDGIGSLYLAFEQLKEKLAKEGLFDESTKLPIPKFPKHIGIITSPTGAAIRDIITTIRRRYPIIKISIIPALVQGEQSAASVVKAIELANNLNEFDVLIVGRGGGSIEELWSFNEEKVARAIATSKVPIISAVGHETDFTISDFVADLRAATPTGAAELAVPSQQELKEKLNAHKRALNRATISRLATAKEKLDQMTRSYAFRYPAQLIQQKEQQLDKQVDQLTKSMTVLNSTNNKQWQHLQKRLVQQHPKKQLIQLKNEINQLTLRTQHAFKSEYQSLNQRFDSTLEKLAILNPLTTMKRGYSVSYSEKGDVIRSSKQVEPGEQITVKLYQGSLDCQVWGIEEEKEND
ncbi:exodeoxyribonuclease VII large subunit [Aquibacillus saliphilus]|uniref:exodeoxyribonuclease VII large subunit n=1 Tax=Aquibacillus saliphilus TaxID=1909422 RepID=UPI001CEFCE3A|nr:exodeoxyribonuclease VII large subunit [Aquibacillus saliphilus]